MASVLDSVKHYQHTIEKYLSGEHKAQHGTARPATGGPAARVVALASGPNLLRGDAAALASGPNLLRGGAAARALAPLPSSGGSSFKPKKASLMAKALQIMRGRKR